MSKKWRYFWACVEKSDYTLVYAHCSLHYIYIDKEFIYEAIFCPLHSYQKICVDKENKNILIRILQYLMFLTLSNSSQMKDDYALFSDEKRICDDIQLERGSLRQRSRSLMTGTENSKAISMGTLEMKCRPVYPKLFCMFLEDIYLW